MVLDDRVDFVQDDVPRRAISRNVLAGIPVDTFNSNGFKLFPVESHRHFDFVLDYVKRVLRDFGVCHYDLLRRGRGNVGLAANIAPLERQLARLSTIISNGRIDQFKDLSTYFDIFLILGIRMMELRYSFLYIVDLRKKSIFSCL